MLRGNAPARVDDKGRLKVPTSFRALIEEKHGREVFITSLTGEYVRIYPMPVWLEIEEKIAAMPSTHPSRLRFLDRINYFGGAGEFDGQGRVLIPYRLRETATMLGDVDVLGQVTFLDIWNHERFQNRMQREPFTDADAHALAGYGI